MGAFPPHQLRLLRDVVVPQLLAPLTDIDDGRDPLDLRLLSGCFDQPAVTRQLVAVLAAEVERTTALTVRLASAVLFERRAHPGALYLAVLPTSTAARLGIGKADTIAKAVPGMELRILLAYGGVLISPPAGWQFPVAPPTYPA